MSSSRHNKEEDSKPLPNLFSVLDSLCLSSDDEDYNDLSYEELINSCNSISRKCLKLKHVGSMKFGLG